MRILIIRHGDPDYSIDGLTEKGAREAELLSNKLVNEGITNIFVSPLGRAQATAAPTVQKTGIEPVTLDWLREFPYHFEKPYIKDRTCLWDMPPEFWTDDKRVFDRNRWHKSRRYRNARILKPYKEICASFDELLADFGFLHDGQIFHIKEGYEYSTDTLAFFCHHGLGLLLVSHLLGMSLPHVWHTHFLLTSSVTTFLMEKHITDRPVAIARMVSMSDTGHLLAGNEPISSSGLHTSLLDVKQIKDETP